MNEEERKSVASVIEANSQRVTLRELAERGNRQFRVISKNTALQLIEAAVEDAIRRGTSDVVQADQDRIVAEAKDQFQRVSQVQAESEATIRQQAELIAEQQARIQQLEQIEQQLKSQIESHAGSDTEWEQTARHQAQALQQAQQHLQEMTQREQKATRALTRLNRRLASARQTIASYEKETDQIAGQVKEDALLIEELRSQVHEREHELSRLKGLMEALRQELANRQRGDTEPASVSQLRDELAEVKGFLKSLEQQNGKASHTTVEAMLQRILEKEEAAKAQLEDRFDGKLADMLGKIDSAIQRATARAIDRPVEATDVFISKVFDEDDAMETNLESLDMQASTAKQSISKSLERLKKLRQQASSPMEEPSGKQGTETADDL